LSESQRATGQYLPHRQGDPVELSEVFAIVRRYWWIVIAVPVVVAIVLFGHSRVRPYQTTVRASVLIPGDTEIPGNSERPELMVMDDVPALVTSRVFAEGVQAAIPDEGLTVEGVHDMLSAERYSRIMTVFITDGNASDVRVVADAVAETLPTLINQYLIPTGGQTATVQVIDPPGDPTRSRPNQTLKMAVLILAGVAAGCFLALLVNFVRVGGWQAEQRT
jgi:capsular polysaccharide biosynthesis protein